MDIDPSPGLELLCSPRNGTYPKVNAFSNGNVRNVTASYAQFATVIDAATLDFNRDLRPDLFILRGSERASDAYQFASGRFEAQFITAPKKTKSVTFKSNGILTLSVSTQAGDVPEGDPAYIDIGSAKWSPAAWCFS